MAFRYEALAVWPLALEYVDACFIVADNLPQKVQFSIGEQLRRAATSILANIAEAAGKATPASERNFYDIARGSVAETVGLLALCQRRHHLSDDHYQRMYNRANLISAMLWGLIKTKVNKKITEPPAGYEANDHSLDEILALPSPASLQAETSPPHLPIASPPRLPASPPLSGLPDDAFFTSAGQMTKREVRLLSLAELALAAGEVMWDIGAGSGSVSLEAARAQPLASVYAIDKRAEMCQHLRENLSRFPAPNLHWLEGMAPEAIANWPDPHAVFIGGSGGRLAAIIELVQRRLHVGGRLVINLVTLENLSMVRKLLPQARMIQAQINRGRPILDMLRFEALNPVFIVAWRKEHHNNEL